MLLRGKRADRLYLEVYSGSRAEISDAGTPEIIPGRTLTGLISYTPGQLGTISQDAGHLHVGQLILAGDEYFVVDEVRGTGGPPAVTFKTVGRFLNSATNVPAYAPPILFEVNEKRGALIWGNAIQFEKGMIIGVGGAGATNELILNGVALPGVGLIPGLSPRVAIPDVNGDYDSSFLGLFQSVPTPPVLAQGAVGTKNMQGGLYSIRIAPARTTTASVGNPSPKAEVSISTGRRIQITFPFMNTGRLQDAWRIYGTLYTANQGIQGPWYYVQTVTADQLGGTGAGTIFEVEWLDGEISRNDLVEFDNFEPPRCQYIATLGGNPIFLSCFGKGDFPPGPNLVPAKRNNIDGAMINLNLRLDPPHTIIGYQVAQGRLFLMTPNSLQIGTLSNLPFAPITTRPFWKRGFHNPYSLVFVNGRLFGWTHNGPTRSALDGEPGSEEFEFGADVREITEGWDDGKVYVAHAPLDELVCYVHSADRLNADGWWTTLILPYSLPHEMWMPAIELTSPDGDMVISGVATVKNRFYFIAGGRKDGEVEPVWQTYEFNSVDVTTPNTVPYFAAWQYSDSGSEDRAKRLSSFRVTGKFQSGKFAIYGENEDGEIEDEPFEDPNLSVSGDIDISSANLKRGERQGLNLRELNLWTARIGGEWTGTAGTPKDRIDEVNVEITVRKMRR